MNELRERRTVWVALAAVPLVWAAQGLLGWLVVSHSCPARDGAHLGARIAVAGLTAVALVVAGWALVEGRSPTAVADVPEVVAERRGFVAFASMFVGSMLGLGVLWAGLPAIFVRVCGEMR